MRRFTTKSAIGLAAMLTLGAVSALAADLTVKLDVGKQHATITNNLAANVMVMYMQGSDHRNYDIQAKLDKGATATVALHHGFPDRVVDAVCTMKNPPLNFPAERDGSYHLSVLVQ